MPRESKTPPFSIRLSYRLKNRLLDLSMNYPKNGWAIGTDPAPSTNISLAVARALELAEPYIDAEVAKVRAGYDWLVARHKEREERLSSPVYLARKARREERALATARRWEAEWARRLKEQAK